MNSLFFAILILVTGSLAWAAPAPTLSLQSFLKEVREKHEGALSYKESALAAKERAEEGDLLLSPTLFSNMTIASDAKPTANPSFQGNKTLFESYELGVSKLTSFGLATKLYYTFSHTDIRGASPAFLPQPKYWDAKPTLEISQSLWRNGFGRETSAGVVALEAKALAESLTQNFKLKMLLTDAESAYWRVVVARELSGVQEKILEASKRLREWNAKRTKMALADKADLLQSEAGLQARTLELQGTKDEMEAAERALNSLRGSTETTVGETLEPLDPEVLLKISAPERKGHRDDVLAAEQGKKAAEAASDLSLEKNSPTFDVFGSVSLNGRDNGLGDAMRSSLKTERPTLAGGLKFQTPLDFGQISDDRRAYTREKKAAELFYQRKLFEEKQSWDELTRRLSDAKRRLSLTLAFQKTQSQKLEHERARLKRGRSVTYQVLLFEQDYSNAEVLRLKTELEILSIVSQLRLFAENAEKGV
jgi:outer membrane protein TolC